MQAPRPALVVLALIAAVEGAVLMGYAVFDVVEAFRVGITGPAEVSNPMALVLLILITAAFGAGLLVVGRGWWRGRRWARGPFILAQLIVGLIGFDLVQAAGSVERLVGATCIPVAIVGLVMCFIPAVRSALDD